MLKKAVIWCRSEMGDKEDLARQKQVLSLFCQESGFEVIRSYSEYGKADNLKLQIFRQMAICKEFDKLIIENLDIFGFSPDEVTEEVKFLNAHGIQVLSMEEGELTKDTLPDLFRKCIKVIVCNPKMKWKRYRRTN